jgi:hypothetical protein
MGSIVSSMLDYMNKNPAQPVSYDRVDHELRHLKIREQLSTGLAVIGTALAMICLAGILGGGNVILGALLTITLLAALYAYSCRLAESGLRGKQVAALPGGTTPQVEKAVSESMLGFFSRTPDTH